MERGYHWIGRLPSGKYALLYADPVLKKTHTQVGLFDTHIDAVRHCRINHIGLETLLAPARKSPVIPSGELPRNQSKVYHALLGLADAKGVARATNPNLLAITKLANVGVLIAVLNSLYRKGLVQRIESGYGDAIPYVYQLAMPEE